MNLITTLTRSALVAAVLVWIVTFLPGLRKIQVAHAAGAPVSLTRFTEPPLLAAQAQAQAQAGICPNVRRIVQDCALAALPGIQALEQQVIADLIATHKLPTDRDQTGHLLAWQRDMLRALLFDRIAQIIVKAPAARTAQEQAIVDDLAGRVKQTRLATATEAKNHFDRWRNSPCSFTPPPGFEYRKPDGCRINNGLSGAFVDWNPPSVEQFETWGAATATSRLQGETELQLTIAGAAAAYAFFTNLAVAAATAGAVFAILAKTVAGAALATAIGSAILPFAATAGHVIGTTAAAAAAAAKAAAAAGVTAVALGVAFTIFIVLLAIAIAVAGLV